MLLDVVPRAAKEVRNQSELLGTERGQKGVMSDAVGTCCDLQDDHHRENHPDRPIRIRPNRAKHTTRRLQNLECVSHYGGDRALVDVVERSPAVQHCGSR